MCYIFLFFRVIMKFSYGGRIFRGGRFWLVFLAENAVDGDKDKSRLCFAALNTDVGPRGEGESLSSSSVIAYGHLFGQLLHYKVVYLANYYSIVESSIWPTITI